MYVLIINLVKFLFHVYLALRHPHIVQFLGVCFLPGSRLPALVMERLMMSLGDLLETTTLTFHSLLSILFCKMLPVAWHICIAMLLRSYTVT